MGRTIVDKFRKIQGSHMCLARHYKNLKFYCELGKIRQQSNTSELVFLKDHSNFFTETIGKHDSCKENNKKMLIISLVSIDKK